MKKLKYIFFLSSVLVIFFLLYFAIKNNRLTLYFEIITIFTCISLLISYISNKSLNVFIDLRVYLLISYGIYALYTPIIYLIFNKTGYIRLSTILNTYSYDIMTKSVFISLLFLLAFSIPFILFNTKIDEKYKFEKHNIVEYTQNNSSFYFWFILLIISFTWYMYPYFKIGFREAYKYGRWYRYIIFNEIKMSTNLKGKIINLFFSPYLIILSTFMMYIDVCNKEHRNKKKIIFAIVVICEAIFYLFIDSRRRELLYIIIMCFSYFIYYSSKFERVINIKKYILFGIIIVSFFVTYQYYRNYFQIASIQGIPYALNMRDKELTSYPIEMKLYINEFGQVYENILSSVKFSPQPFYGKTYLESVLAPIPIINKILYTNGDKTIFIERWQSQIYPNIFKLGGGLGFFPAAEAFLNLGYLGCLTFGLLLGVFFNLVYKKLYSWNNIIYYSILLPEGWNFSRISFLGVTSEIFWFLFYLFLYSSILQIQQHRRYFSISNFIN